MAENVKNTSVGSAKDDSSKETISGKGELGNSHNEKPFGRSEWEQLQKRIAVIYENLRAYHTNLQHLLADTQQKQGKKNSG
ncbi:hypothetical protein Mgra_00003553 [Meloidogyne graminicola]|uniref:Uncharacterized protein n=1 Tax=Meloidogyne graminicola TaxID=189291 RepID=A0A8S9ZUR4_9BILA|nr:hypothetical protein Mgra_00003553 [Meloidogyne graminicola]